MQGVYGVQGTGVMHEDTTEVGYQVGIPGGIPAKISGIVLSSLSPPLLYLPVFTARGWFQGKVA
jgi:hypothetical protein